MKIHVFGSCEKKLYCIGNVIVPSCVCVCVLGGGGGGAVLSLGSSFFICFFRQKAVVFHSLKAREFLCGDEGDGTEAFLVNNVKIITYRLF